MKLNGLEMPKKVFQALLSMDEALPIYGEKIKNEKSLILSKKSLSKFINEVEDAITKDPKIEETKKLSLLNAFSKYEEEVNLKFEKEDSESEDEDEKKEEESTQEIEDSEEEEKGEKEKNPVVRKRSRSKEEKKEENKKAKKPKKETVKKNTTQKKHSSVFSHPISSRDSSIYEDCLTQLSQSAGKNFFR